MATDYVTKSGPLQPDPVSAALIGAAVSSANCGPLVGENAMAWRELQRWRGMASSKAALSRPEKTWHFDLFPFRA